MNPVDTGDFSSQYQRVLTISKRVSGKTKGEMLIAAPLRVDEACFSVPAVRALVASGLTVGVLCQESQVVFWEKISGVTVVSFPPKADVKKIAASLSEAWSAALIWEKGDAVNLIVKAQIEKRIGPEMKALRKILTHPVSVIKEPGPVEHRVRFYLSIVEKLGITTSKPEFFAPVIESRNASVGHVLLSPDSDFGPTYEWPLERWTRLAESLQESGKKLSLIGWKGGRENAKQLAQKLGGEISFHEITSSSEAFELLSTCELMISSDGSLPHVAAFLGVTCMTLFGPGDPVSRRPLGRQHGIAHRHVECAPCFLEKCPMDLRCQNDLTVERVLSLIQSVKIS